MLFHNITCCTKSLLSHIHINIAYLLDITCTLVATGTRVVNRVYMHADSPCGKPLTEGPPFLCQAIIIKQCKDSLDFSRIHWMAQTQNGKLPVLELNPKPIQLDFISQHLLLGMRYEFVLKRRHALKIHVLYFYFLFWLTIEIHGCISKQVL